MAEPTNNRTKFSDLFTKTDLHGLPDWYAAETKSKKSVWSVVMFVAFVLLCVELYHLGEDFSNRPLVSNYEMVNTKTEGGTALPEVFICPSSPVVANRLEPTFDTDWVFDHIGIEFFKRQTAAIAGLSGLLAAHTRTSVALLEPKSAPSSPKDEPKLLFEPETVQEYFMKAGYRLEDLFKECAVKSRAVACSTIVTPYFDGDYGKCFHIHVNSKQIADGSGLSLVLDLNMGAAYPRADFGMQPMFDGVYLKLNEHPQPITDEIVLIPAGSINQVHMQPLAVDLVPYLNTDLIKDPKDAFCVDETTASKFEILHMNYSQLACVQDCSQRVVVEACGCFVAIDEKFINRTRVPTDVQACDRNEVETCIANALKDKREFLENCTNRCRAPCISFTYQPQLNSVTFPSYRVRTKNQYGPPMPEPQGNEQKYYASICHHPFVYKSSFDETNDKTATNHTRWGYSVQERDCVSYTYFGVIPGENGAPLTAMAIAHSLRNFFRSRTACLHHCAYGNPCLAVSAGAKTDLANFAKPQHKHCFGTSTNRYFYSIERAECRRFHFGGCDANRNHFKTRKECQQRCEQDTALKDNICHKNVGKLNELQLNAVAWNTDMRMCEEIDNKWHSCANLDTVKNRFHSYAECYKICQRPFFSPSPKRCTESSVITPRPNCSLVDRYYYDIIEADCKPIQIADTFEEKDNVFETKTACERRCQPQYEKPINWDGYKIAPLRKPEMSTDDYFSQGLMNGDFLILHISYNKLRYVHINQGYKMTFSTFISNIGGQLGLWLGCSIISIFKVVSITLSATVALLLAKLIPKQKDIVEVLKVAAAENNQPVVAQ